LQIVNPDVIARELNPTDPTRGRVRLQAGREAIHRQEALLHQGTDFSIETTLSGNRELELLQRAREAGYKVTLVYVGVNSKDVLVGRITQRVREGGHDVPTNDIDRRHTRSMANLARALEHVDRAFILDNSSQRYRLLLSMERSQVKHRSRNLPRWARNALPSGLLQSQKPDP
jgi:predicted ABC-type ATPase